MIVSTTAPAHAQNKIGNVRVAGVDVSGLNQAQARQRLTRELASKLNYQHVLIHGKTAVRRQRRYLGAHLDVDGMVRRALTNKEPRVPLMLKINAKALQKSLHRVAPAFIQKGRPARVGEWKGKVVIAPEAQWRRLDVSKSVWPLITKWQKNPGTKYLPVKAITSQPALTAARLKGVNGVIGRYTTRFNPGNVKRTGNVKLGIAAIDGALLSPGEVFSLNKTVGERTQKRGYRTTIIFKNSYRAPGIGGGISQVTGTLFNAALLAGLEIVTYQTHSRPVSYIPIGRDATVAWGSFDMKFKNNTKSPVYIKYKIKGDRATATLFGRKQKQDVNLKVVQKTLGPQEKKAQLYRTIRRNGKVVAKQKVGDSHYQWKEGDWYD